MKILYVPLDERPCNYDYPQHIACLQPQLQLVVPPLDLLGQKKQPANVDRLWEWLVNSLDDCDCAILSLEMLVYGGLLPSRLHQLSRQELHDRLLQFRRIATRWPSIRLLASNLIMRAPQYSSSEEEPDYYETHGEQLFQWGWLKESDRRMRLSALERSQLEDLTATIPSQYLEDYRERRRKNLEVNLAAIDLVTDGVFDFLAIPQDDCAEYGFTASDRQKVYERIAELNLHRQIHVYPGADEVGCSLLARTYTQHLNQAIKIYPLYSSLQGSQLIPLYEDRPIADSTPLHIRAAGAEISESLNEADIVLAVHVPNQRSLEAKDQIGAKDQANRDESHLHPSPQFLECIQHLIAERKPLAIADVAFANGGDTKLVKQMDRDCGWDRVLAYGSWNTCGNSLGSTISTAIVGLGSDAEDVIAFNTIYHLLEGWGYQAVVRWELMDSWISQLGATYFDLDGHTVAVEVEIGRRLEALWGTIIQRSFQDWRIESLEVRSPWHRMFEIGLTFQLQRHR